MSAGNTSSGGAMGRSASRITDSNTPRPPGTWLASPSTCPNTNTCTSVPTLTPNGASSAYRTRLASNQSTLAVMICSAARRGPGAANRQPPIDTCRRARTFHTKYPTGTARRSTPNDRRTSGDVGTTPVMGTLPTRQATPPTVATPSHSVTVVNATPSATSPAESPHAVQNRYRIDAPASAANPIVWLNP